MAMTHLPRAQPISSPPTSTRPPRSGAARSSCTTRPARLLHARADAARHALRPSSAAPRVPDRSSASTRSSSSCTSATSARAIALALEKRPARRLQRRRPAARAALGAGPRDGARAPSHPRVRSSTPLLGRFGLPAPAEGRARRTSSTRWSSTPRAFRAATGFTYEVDEVQAMHEFAAAVPMPDVQNRDRKGADRSRAR